MGQVRGFGVMVPQASKEDVMECLWKERLCSGWPTKHLTVRSYWSYTRTDVKLSELIISLVILKL